MPRKKAWRSMMQADAADLVCYAIESFLEEHEGMTQNEIREAWDDWDVMTLSGLCDRYVREWDKRRGTARNKAREESRGNARVTSVELPGAHGGSVHLTRGLAAQERGGADGPSL